MYEPYLNFYFSAFHVWWRDDLNWWRVGGGEITSPGGEVVGGEMTCGGEMVGGESSWWRDGRKPGESGENRHHFGSGSSGEGMGLVTL